MKKKEQEEEKILWHLSLICAHQKNKTKQKNKNKKNKTATSRVDQPQSSPQTPKIISTTYLYM